MKQMHVKSRLITFVSTFRHRFVARAAEHDLRDYVIGATIPTKDGVKESYASNNSAKRLSPK